MGRSRGGYRLCRKNLLCFLIDTHSDYIHIVQKTNGLDKNLIIFLDTLNVSSMFAFESLQRVGILNVLIDL